MPLEEDDFNPLRAIFEDMGLVEEPTAECVHRYVWVPVPHPISGETVYIKAIDHDHIIPSGQAEELETMVNGPLARNTPDDYYGADD